MSNIQTPDKIQQNNRLLELHYLIKQNGVTSMSTRELCEYSELFALSLQGKGNPPIQN